MKGKDENDNSPLDDPPRGYVTEKLCQAYRQTMMIEMRGIKDDIKDIKEDIGKVDRRIWWVLGSVVVFGVISIIIALFG